ncbi:Nucleoporin Nup54 alpha-helical domain [Trinorchestia longiramus]|nr:Nucleoporin Nup54 alpha-helical domain [Trinorchestia longiramus]
MLPRRAFLVLVSTSSHFGWHSSIGRQFSAQMSRTGRRNAFSFGSNTSGFGSAGNTNSAFGTGNKSFPFGGSTSSAAPAFGSTNTNTTAFTGFGTNTGTATGFGSSQPAVSSSGGGFGFGSNTNTLGSGGFSFGSSKPAGGGFSFGNNTNTGLGTGTSTGFGVGTNTGFGTATTSSSGFGTGTFGTGTNIGFGTGTSNFGTGTNSFGSGGGGLFGGGLKTTQNTPGFGLGTASNTFKGFGQPQQQQQQQMLQQHQQGAGLCPSVSLYMAVCAPAYFSDERDEVLKKWNQLQAVWGFGKGFYAPGLPPVEFSPDNEFCRFKAVGYIKMPTFSPEEGLVELVINKKESIVREQQAGLVGELCKVYGGAVQVCVEYVKPGPGDCKTRLCFYVQHRNPNGETKKANTWEVYQHLRNDQHRQTITNLCIETATPLVALTEVQLKEYLEKPPRGLDPVLWEQGKRDNPDPSKYLPVPLVGFQELQARFKAQETESTLLQGQLDKIAGDVCSMQSRLATLQDHLAECHRKQRQMAHRVLQLVVRQECVRKRGVPITSTEEKLRLRLENLQSQLHAPTQYMGKLNELLSQMSAQGSNGVSSAENSQLSPETEGDVKEFLSWQQDGISEVVAILKSDMKALEAMVKSKGK